MNTGKLQIVSAAFAGMGSACARLGLALCLLAAGSTGCSSDGSAPSGSPLFLNLIGTQGDSYMTLSVDVDPAAVGVFIDTTSCDLNEAIAGCQLLVSGEIAADTSTNGGSSTPITVTIDCRGQLPIPAFENLVSCLTTSDAPSQQVAAATATCSAATPGCDTTPDVCVTDLGPECFCACDGPTTSSTRTTSTTSSTVTTSTTLRPAGTTTTSSSTLSTIVGGSTSTTALCDGIEFDVPFAMVEPATVGALQFNVDYSAAPGAFNGNGQAALCTVIVDLGLGFPAFNNQTESRLLVAALTSVSGFTTSGNTEIVRCSFLSCTGVVPSPADFVVTVVDASDPSTNPIDPASVVVLPIVPR